MFEKGKFTLHSGGRTWFKIDCDSLTVEDLETLALLVAEDPRIGTFYRVEGVPSGGLRFAMILDKYALSQYANVRNPKILIVDDVLTTGNSMEEQRAGRENVQGVVIFARGNCPDWIVPIFQMDVDDD